MIATLLTFAAALATAPTTADLKFMVGEWALSGAFNPGASGERRETGVQRCALALGGAYVRCERRLRSASGAEREQVTFHNYNRLYGRFEHLFISSNWPTKVIGSSPLVRRDDASEMAIDMRFTLPDGRIEHVRSVDRYEAGRFTSDEQLRVDDGEWRTNYRLTGVRTGD